MDIFERVSILIHFNFLTWVILAQFQSARKDSRSKLDQNEYYEQFEVDQSFKFLFNSDFLPFRFVYLFRFSEFFYFSLVRSPIWSHL